MFKPDKKEELRVKKIIKEFIKKLKIRDAKVVLGGSGAKGTWLPGTHDVDIFVKFNYNKYKDKKNLDNILQGYLKKKFKISRLHGSRDYFQIKYEGFTFEVVPILDIRNAKQAKNITDISPLHARWVNKHKYKDDIRRLKLFCRSNKLYGAESYISGFSGYALEVLCIYYRGFNKTIKNITKWKVKTILDPEKQLKNPLKELNKSKIHAPLILVDPVDKSRNVCAALSKEKFEKLIKVCKQYLKNPSDRFFKKQEEKIPKGSIILEVECKKGKQDIIAAKMMKAYKFIRKQLKLNGFNVQSNWDFDRRVFWFYVKNKLNTYEMMSGPFIKDEYNVKRFKKKYRNAIKKRNRYYAKIKRKFITGKELIKFLVKKKEVKSRIKSIKFKR